MHYPINKLQCPLKHRQTFHHSSPVSTRIYIATAIKDHFEVAQCPLWHCKLMSISVAMGYKRRKLQCYEACTQGKKVATKDIMKAKIKWLFKHDGEGESILSPPPNCS